MPTSTGRIRAGEPSPPWNCRRTPTTIRCRSALRATAWKNLTLNSTYTWSHAFDIIDGEIFSNVNNPFNARWDYGPAGFDRRQISVTSFIYKFPFFRNSGQPGNEDGAGRMGALRHRTLRVREPAQHRRRRPTSSG